MPCLWPRPELFKLDAAEKNAQQVLAKDPNNAMAYAALGAVSRNRTSSLDMTYKSKRDQLLADSVQKLQRAASLSPTSPEIQNQLGETYRFQGHYAQAQRAFETALHDDPDFAEALVNEGICRQQQGDTQGAKAAYQRAIQRNSKNYNAPLPLRGKLSARGQLSSGHAIAKYGLGPLSREPGDFVSDGRSQPEARQHGSCACELSSGHFGQSQLYASLCWDGQSLR